MHKIFTELSDASKMTLEHQGGPMSLEEADIFRKSKYFEAILRMRTWDEQAKDPLCQTAPLEFFEALCRDYLTEILSNK